MNFVHKEEVGHCSKNPIHISLKHWNYTVSLLLTFQIKKLAGEFRTFENLKDKVHSIHLGKYVQSRSRSFSRKIKKIKETGSSNKEAIKF